MIKQWFFGDKQIVPMVMFHSVGLEALDWEYHHIAEPVRAFEAKIAALSKAGFNFITWEELSQYIRGEAEIDLPAIVLTFDDGYLDNWVYAYPILKKYGAKGTIFVSPDFVDSGEQCRFNLDDVNNGRCSPDQLQPAGFLNWEEMRQMERSGVIDIQSHASTHTWYFSGPKIVDFWRPDQKQHCWMAWNKHPERKPYYLNENQWDFVELGTPVFEHEKSLCVQRFFPSQGVSDGLVEFVRNKGGKAWFEAPDAIEKLQQKAAELTEKWNSDCRYETDDERRVRTLDELSRGKHEIEQHLDKTVDYICWPGGGYDALTLELAREAGFKSWTLGSRDQSSVRNVPGSDAEQIKRIGSAPKQTWRGRDLGFTGGTEFLCGVREHQGSGFHLWLKRGFKSLRIAGIRF